jgi:hypothetical protein
LLLEQLAKTRQLLGVQNSFDLLVGAIPDGAHLGRWASRTAAAFAAACGIGRRTTTTAAPTAPSTAPASSSSPSATLTSHSSALTARAFSEILQLHGFVNDDRADSGLLRGIEL